MSMNTSLTIESEFNGLSYSITTTFSDEYNGGVPDSETHTGILTPVGKAHLARDQGFRPIGHEYRLSDSEFGERGAQIVLMNTDVVIMKFAEERGDKMKFQRGIEQKPKEKAADVKITYAEAEIFIRKRFQTQGQSLVEGRTIDINGTSMHTFISNDLSSGLMCISTVSEYELDVFAADCGPASQKLMEWNSLVN